MNSFLGLIVLAFAIFNMAAGEIGDDDKDFLNYRNLPKFLRHQLEKN
jgi:hypothetical protein